MHIIMANKALVGMITLTNGVDSISSKLLFTSGRITFHSLLLNNSILTSSICFFTLKISILCDVVPNTVNDGSSKVHVVLTRIVRCFVVLGLPLQSILAV